jgi:hypothetical protein
MSYHFKSGQKLKAINYEHTSFRVGEPTILSGQSTLNTVVDIEVVMELGQASYVPWAVVKYVDGSIFKENLAMAHGVEYFKEN